MKHKARVNKLWAKLTAKARAIAVLRAFKMGEEEHPMVRRKMPREQTRDFNYHISLIHGVHVELMPLVVICSTETEPIRLRLALLHTLRLWGMCVQKILHRTGAYDSRVGDDSSATLTLDKAGDSLLEDIRAISRSAPMLSWEGPGPCSGLTYWEHLSMTEDLGVGDELGKALIERIRSDIETCWGEIEALQLVLQEVAEVFGGEDPLPETWRELLDRSRTELKDLCQECQHYTGPIELPGPSEAVVKKLREALGPRT